MHHRFHRHSALEEILYVLSGSAEQWVVGREKRILRAGEIAHVPVDEVHGTYNIFDEPLVFLAILSPAVFEGAVLVHVSADEPWRSLDPLGDVRGTQQQVGSSPQSVTPPGFMRAGGQ